jgi:uncharacterized protein YndB with AHSA1/START domain
MPNMNDLTLTRSFPVPLERLFTAWSERDWMGKWFSPGGMTIPEVDVDFRVGGRYRVVMQSQNNERHAVGGEYLEIVLNRTIRFTWQWEGSPVCTEVEVTFTSVEGGSELQLLHKQFPDAEMRDKHGQGWTGCLDRLDVVLTGRERAITQSSCNE